jgi:energy-coupling factor transport system ATP-binding protein
VGIVFQDPESQLFADSLLDDVAFGPRNLGLGTQQAEQRASRALAAVGLPPGDFGQRSPFSLSGGEARRAAIAGVLAMEPRYLLADEPTAGLDARGRRAVRNLLLELRERAGVVVVSHAAEEFLGEADRLVVLSGGAAAWSGPGRDAVDDPSVLSCCGLRPPDVLEVQRLAVERGAEMSTFALDPQGAARQLLAGRR